MPRPFRPSRLSVRTTWRNPGTAVARSSFVIGNKTGYLATTRSRPPAAEAYDWQPRPPSLYGMYYETVTGKWTALPRTLPSGDVAFLFYAYRPSNVQVEVACGGFSARATRCLTRKLKIGKREPSLSGSRWGRLLRLSPIASATPEEEARERLVVLHKFALILGDCRE